MAEVKQVVLVTGCSGYIGGEVIKRLKEKYHIIGMDIHPPQNNDTPVEFVHIDLSSDDSVQSAMVEIRKKAGNRIASVVHLAAYFDLSGKKNYSYEEITVRGTERLLSGLQYFEVEQFIFSSTMLVHKPCMQGERINEDWPLDDRFPYRTSKIETESIIREKRGNIPVVMLRPAGVYDDSCHNVFLAHQIARIWEKRLISHLYPADLSTGQSFLHIDDLLDAIERLVARRRKLPDELPLLLGEEEVISVDTLQKNIGKFLHGKEWHTWQIPSALAKTGAWIEDDVMGEDQFIKPWMVDIAGDYYALDISRARKLLDWEPKHNLQESLPRICDELKENPEKWYKEHGLNAAKMTAHSVQEVKTPSKEDMQAHMQKMYHMHLNTLWTHFACIMLGLWLAVSPFVWGHFWQTEFASAALHVTQDRGLADLASRIHWLAWSDFISGLLIVAFGSLSLFKRFGWAQWANTAVGCWLLFAPLIFWSPSLAVYDNDTLVGALVIAFSILVPMMPGMSHEGMMDETDIPPGWTYSPSTYAQRIPIIALGFIGFLIARYLTAYQLGIMERVWDPFFGSGTATIITSSVSKAWPIPDAGLGAVSYMFEVLMGIMGSSKRWRTMPWMVLGFGIVVVPLGAVSIFFIIIQPIVIGTWCSLCLLAAAAMVLMIPFTLDEVVASCQFLYEVHRRKLPFWKNFFKGGPMPGGREEKEPTKPEHYFDISDLTCGVTWQLAVCTVIGIALMFTRLIFNTAPPMVDSDHLIGSLVIVFSISAMAEVGRTLRFLNIPLGLWLVIAPWLLDGASSVASWGGVVAGVAVILLSLPRGRRSSEHYGSWDRFVL